HLVIAPGAAYASVTLDGTHSSDPDGDILKYTWYKVGNSAPLGTGAQLFIPLSAGTHSIVLVVDDGFLSATNGVSVQVLTASGAINDLAATVNSSVPQAQLVLAELAAAAASIERGAPVTAIHRLVVFQNLVRAQIGAADPSLAASLLQSAQQIVDVLS